MRRGLTESFFMQHPPAGGPDGFTLWGVCGLFGVRPKVILRACARGEFPPPSYSLPRCPRWSDAWLWEWMELPGPVPWQHGSPGQERARERLNPYWTCTVEKDEYP